MTLLRDSDVTPDFYQSDLKISGIPANKGTGKERRSTTRNQSLSFHKAFVPTGYHLPESIIKEVRRHMPNGPTQRLGPFFFTFSGALLVVSGRVPTYAANDAKGI